MERYHLMFFEFLSNSIELMEIRKMLSPLICQRLKHYFISEFAYLMYNLKYQELTGFIFMTYMYNNPDGASVKSCDKPYTGDVWKVFKMAS